MLLAGKPAHLSVLRDAIPADQAVIAADDWTALLSCAPRADCAIVVVPWLGDPPARHALAMLAGDLPRLPLVLVTTKDADNARLLAHMHATEVVWLHECATRAWAAVRRARSSDVLERLFASIASALPADIVSVALLHLWHADPPIRSIAELARTLHRDRRTLWRRWRGGALARRGLRLEDVLDWVRLLRAVRRKESAKSWGAVAAEIGVHEHTLHRWARRLAGRGLGHFAPGDDQLLARQFVARVVRPMLESVAEPAAVGPPMAQGLSTMEPRSPIEHGDRAHHRP